MSIHEVTYDTEGRIVTARCIDDAIRLAQQIPDEIIESADGNPVGKESNDFPKLKHVLRLAQEHEPVLPFTFHSFIARTTETVEEISNVMGIGRSGVVEIVDHSSRTYTGDEINAANVRVGEVGFRWTRPGENIDVYVAPKAPTPQAA